MDEQPLKKMFDSMIDKKQYIMAEGYLEMVRATFSEHEEYIKRIYVEKANDLTKRIVEEE